MKMNTYIHMKARKQDDNRSDGQKFMQRITYGVT
jgi:hypothetical protein